MIHVRSIDRSQEQLFPLFGTQLAMYWMQQQRKHVPSDFQALQITKGNIMFRNQTSQTQRPKTFRNSKRGAGRVLGIFLAASGLILAVSAANADGTPYSTRQPAAHARQPGVAAWNVQRQAVNRINNIRHVADSRAAQTRIRQQLGRPWFATPRVQVQLGAPVYATPNRSRSNAHSGSVEYLSELGFNAVASYPQGLQVVSVAGHGVAANLRLEPGDVVLQINRCVVNNSHDVRSALRNVHDGNLEFLIRDVRTGRVDIRTTHLQ